MCLNVTRHQRSVTWKAAKDLIFLEESQQWANGSFHIYLNTVSFQTFTCLSYLRYPTRTFPIPTDDTHIQLNILRFYISGRRIMGSNNDIGGEDQEAWSVTEQGASKECFLLHTNSKMESTAYIPNAFPWVLCPRDGLR